MARENIAYAKCNCDICGKEEHIPQSLVLPKEWNEIRVGGCKLELCKECFCKIEKWISAWIKEKRVP